MFSLRFSRPNYKINNSSDNIKIQNKRFNLNIPSLPYHILYVLA